MKNDSPPDIAKPPPALGQAGDQDVKWHWLALAGISTLLILVLFALVLFASAVGASAGTAAKGSSVGSKSGASDAVSVSKGSGKEQSEDAVQKSKPDVKSKPAKVINPTQNPNAESEAIISQQPSNAKGDAPSANPPKKRSLSAINNSLASPSAQGFFGIPATGDHIGFVIDCSSSMSTDTRLKRANTELMRAISNLPPTVSVSVVYFSSGVQVNNKFCNFQPSTKQVEQLARWTSTVRPNGNTNPVPGVEEVIHLGCDQIFLLSDGEFSRGTYDLIRRKNHRKVPINTIAMNGEPRTLKEIARKSGGTFTSTKHWVPPPANC